MFGAGGEAGGRGGAGMPARGNTGMGVARVSGRWRSTARQKASRHSGLEDAAIGIDWG